MALVVLAMLLSSAQMSELRIALPWLSRTMSWLEGIPLPLDMDHVAFFALLAVALRLLLADLHWRWLLVGLTVLAVGTELLQFATIGRTPRLLDARDDLVGAGIGLLVGGLLLHLLHHWWRPKAIGNGLSAGSATSGAREESLHAVLAAWLSGRETLPAAAAVAQHGVNALLARCESEGVVSLVHAHLSGIPATMGVTEELLKPLAEQARSCVARTLLCLGEARRIQQALDVAGIPCLWLKGLAVGQWLYPNPCLRDMADIDLLLPDHATVLRAAEVLAPLGYTLPNPHIAGDLVVHELLAWNERLQLELDLHWDVSNRALFAGRLPWHPLLADAIALPMLGGIAWLSFRLTQNPAHPVSPVLALWLLPVPVIDTLSLIATRIARGHSPFFADRNHVHHLMLDAGFGVTSVVVVLGGFSLLCGLLAAQAMRLDVPNLLLLLLFFAVLAWWMWLTWRRERAIGFFRGLRTLGAGGTGVLRDARDDRA